MLQGGPLWVPSLAPAALEHRTNTRPLPLPPLPRPFPPGGVHRQADWALNPLHRYLNPLPVGNKRHEMGPETGADVMGRNFLETKALFLTGPKVDLPFWLPLYPDALLMEACSC